MIRIPETDERIRKTRRQSIMRVLEAAVFDALALGPTK